MKASANSVVDTAPSILILVAKGATCDKKAVACSCKSKDVVSFARSDSVAMKCVSDIRAFRHDSIDTIFARNESAADSSFESEDIAFFLAYVGGSSGGATVPVV